MSSDKMIQVRTNSALVCQIYFHPLTELVREVERYSAS